MQLYLPIADLPVNILVILGLGVAVGFISGMFGIGGGFLMTPLLIFLGISPAVAVATVPSHIAASSFSSAISYWRRNAIDLPLALMLLVGGVLGTIAGVALFTLLRRLGQLDVTIGLSYVLLLSGVGAMLAAESLRAIIRERQGKPVELRRPGSHTWLHRLPFKLRFKRSRIFISADPDLGDRVHHGLHRLGDGHRRRIPAGADAGLRVAGADRDGGRHVHRPDAGHHDLGNAAACRDQPSGGCGAGADPHGGRQHRRAVRRAGRPKDAGRTACACCWAS